VVIKCSNDLCEVLTSNPKYCSRSCGIIQTNKDRAFLPPQSSRKCSGCGNPTRNRTIHFCDDGCRQALDDKLIEARIYARVRKTSKNDQKIYDIWSSGTTQGLEKPDGSLSVMARAILLRVRGAQCSVCGWGEVNPVSGSIPITVDHIDGDALNNAVSNLEILCPNHHSLTPTYGSLNLPSVRQRNGLTPLDREYARFGRVRKQ
jgi:hypothetical protein